MNKKDTKNKYNFEKLIAANPLLKPFVFKNKYNNVTIDFSNPKAVKALNKALLFSDYNITFWDFPDENLCPPIPSRATYLKHIATLLQKENSNLKGNVLDIGTGASCIYPLLGTSMYSWSFVGTDIDKDSLKVAQNNIDKNNFKDKIELRLQTDKSHILKGVIKEKEQFLISICNPPFYKSAQEAEEVNQRKAKNLGTTTIRNFAGNKDELWYVGGEKAFLHTYLYESSLFPKASKWFTSLVSKKENVKSLETSAKKIGVKTFKIIPMHLGNKMSRIVAWRFKE